MYHKIINYKGYKKYHRLSEKSSILTRFLIWGYASTIRLRIAVLDQQNYKNWSSNQLPVREPRTLSSSCRSWWVRPRRRRWWPCRSSSGRSRTCLGTEWCRNLSPEKSLTFNKSFKHDLLLRLIKNNLWRLHPGRLGCKSIVNFLKSNLMTNYKWNTIKSWSEKIKMSLSQNIA